MEIVLYAFTVMYTPGPVNLMGLNAGLTESLRRTWGFFVGVALAMFCWFAVIGFAGQLFIIQSYVRYIAIAGSVYILYLAVKVFRSSGAIDDKSLSRPATALSFGNGFFMQLMNPKNSLVVVPITTVMFPGRGITGVELALFSAVIAIGGGGAPALYFWVGKAIGSQITQEKYFRFCDYVMSLLLVVVAILMFYDYVIAPRG